MEDPGFLTLLESVDIWQMGIKETLHKNEEGAK